MTLADPATCTHHFMLNGRGEGECKFCGRFHPRPEPRAHGQFMERHTPKLMEAMREESGGALHAALDAVREQQRDRR